LGFWVVPWWRIMDILLKIIATLSSAALGIAAIIIAVQQLKLAKYRMKHDLFEKRFKAFMKLREFVSEVALSDDFDPGAFYRGTIERRFLFDRTGVSEYFDSVYEKSNRLKDDIRTSRRENLPEAQRDEVIERINTSKMWFFDQSDEMFKVFSPDLSIKTLE